jgi:hypothetical protein
MNLYIDKENVFSLIENSKHELYADCIKTMQKQMNVFFNFSKTELVSSEILIAWIKLFTSGVGASSIQRFNDEKFPERPLKTNTHNSFDKEQLSSVYLVNDERIELLAEKGALLIGRPGEEIDVFNQVFLFNNDYKFEKKLIIGDDNFKTWTTIEKFALSVSDILFVDSYILSDATLIEHNFIKLLKTLVSKSRCKVNIVVLVNTDKQAVAYDDLSKRVRQAVNEVTGVNPNFTLISVRHQRGVTSHAEHDRTIFTNYSRFYSGDTFNYFGPNGEKITKGRELHISSFGDFENHSVSLKLVEDLQLKINALPDSAIEGDKKSNFLSFA